ncbi:family 16 glycoside hydrolase [Planctomycetes bacterium K23_9]|uniref:3-keto-alpha-glucoside-1,2-lyase/3-keto-2-hydroxy-glucal hydratase domain-containing protein n=1 Tax=Stieleria marina TaxID=1930275 RepID=A0A517NUX6_9BACT|nr:hypothetical protein K239x_29180 [Planctomycetes bacterium K23_9]
MSNVNVLCLLASAMMAVQAFADEPKSTVAFTDTFDRTGQVGNEWKLNTKEKHEFVLKDGAVHITRNTDAKHSANMLHQAQFQNGTLAMRFKLLHEEDSFNVQVRNSQFTDVKQGMLFNVRIANGTLELQDAVVAYHNKKAMQAKNAAEPTPTQKAELDKATAAVPVKLSIDQWHKLLVSVQDDQLAASIDGKELVSLSSKSIGHPTKDNFRLEVKLTLVVDEISVTVK